MRYFKHAHTMSKRIPLDIIVAVIVMAIVLAYGISHKLMGPP